jgi:hypothetical protein
MARRFSDLGLPIESSLLLSNLPAAGGETISTAIDASGNCSVSWVDSRSGFRRVYMTTILSDNSITPVSTVTDEGVIARGEHGSLAMTGDKILAVWADNRQSGKGYDVYLNSQDYSASPADEQDDPLVPTGFVLAQNYPNPFNPLTTIRFRMPKAGAASLEILNMLGQVVNTVRWSNLAPGWHEYEYDASQRPSGVYFYRVRTGQYTQSKKMALVK